MANRLPHSSPANNNTFVSFRKNQNSFSAESKQPKIPDEFLNMFSDTIRY